MRSWVELNVPAVAPRARPAYDSILGQGGCRVRMRTNAIMKRVIAFAAIGLFVSGCSSWVPSFDMSAFKSAPATEPVRVESEPPGADARTSAGAACRTPCTLGLPINDGTVTVALNGYAPQTVPVQVERPSEGRPDEFTGTSAHLTPNPIFVELQPAPPPPPVAKKPPPKKPRVVAHAKPAVPVQSAAPAAGSAPPPPGGAMPEWPTPR